jgi:hypothetical protein
VTNEELDRILPVSGALGGWSCEQGREGQSDQPSELLDPRVLYRTLILREAELNIIFNSGKENSLS